MFQIDDKVIVVSSGIYVNAIKPGTIGIITKVDPDDDLLTYSVKFGDKPDCLWCTANLEKTDHVTIELYIPETNKAPKNDYTAACWHCREGGTVDRLAFATGLILTCPVCGRVCDGRKVN